MNFNPFFANTDSDLTDLGKLRILKQNRTRYPIFFIAQ